MKNLLSAGVLLFAVTACHQKDPSAARSSSNQEAATDSIAKTFFPVADYLRSEISYVDSTPLAIVRYKTENKKTDSVFISSQQFHQLAQEFIAPELEPAVFGKEYKENSFMDETSKSLSFTYSTPNGKLGLRRVDVLATPGTIANKVKSIYLERQEEKGDTLFIKKMYWQAKKEFEIVTMTRTKGNQPVVRELKVVWDPGD